MGILERIFGKSKPKKHEDNYPEDNYLADTCKVTITDEYIKVEHPERKTEEILWTDIEQIKLINTDSGTFYPDVWMALIGEHSGCLIPQGAEGFQAVYDIVSKYENFDFENFTKSMSCTDDEEFLVWEKE